MVVVAVLEGARHNGVQRRRVRIEQSRQELERLLREFAHWREQRDKADGRQQYATQLASLELAVTTSLAHVAENLAAVSQACTTRELHERCRRTDCQVIFVRRLWGYFRDKWAQRDDPALAPVLAAADEVVWSCYAPPFRHLGRDPGSAPLPFFDDDFSPYAVPYRHPPAALSPSDELLQRTLAEMPMPVIGIPPVCAARPWWLAILAHEVGHQVPYAFDDRPVAAARLAIEEATGGALWSDWTDELFADAYAAALVGGAHHWALVELEQGGDATMIRSARDYPPPLVRHALTAQMSIELGLSAADSLPPIRPAADLDELEIGSQERAWVGQLLADVPAVAAALAGTPLLGGASLAQATGLDFAELSRKGGAAWWAERFAEHSPIPPSETLAAPRLATIGALVESTRILDEPDPQRREVRAEALREGMLEAVAASHEQGRRAGKPTDGGAGAFAGRLARELLALPADAPPPAPSVRARG